MISVILCLTLLIGMLPAAVAVVPGMKGGTPTNVGNSEGLQDLTIEDGIAAVRFAVSEDAELVVAVYEEESGRQIASAKTTVRPSDSTAILPLDTALPQNFHAEAFLLSPNDYTPLCKSLRVEVNEPTLPTEPSEPTETTAPTEPSEPTETTAPTEPSEPTETAAPTEPSEPTETAAPTEPASRRRLLHRQSRASRRRPPHRRNRVSRQRPLHRRNQPSQLSPRKATPALAEKI